MVDNIQNLIHSTTQDIEYDELHNPKSIVENGNEWHFEYDVNHHRNRAQIISSGGSTTTRVYVGNSEYQYDQNGDLLYSVDYVAGGDGLCALVVRDFTPTATTSEPQVFTVYKDYLGSINVLVDENGTVAAEQEFDPWGRYRDANTWTSSATLPALPDWLWRGYTGHEHIEEFQLINMNGRLYDPYLGRMLSPDNYVQDATSTQNYNRYSYALNNPLKYTDPSGEIIFTAATLIAAPFTGGASLALLPMAIGADLGMWQGGTLANGTANPTKWDYSSGKTWGYMAGGAAIGAASGGTANAVATSGIAFANTAAIFTGSFVSSFGMNMLSGGQTDVSVSIGFGSYNFDSGEFGYLGKKGNSPLENIGYGLGALANVSDMLAGFNPSDVQLNTEKSDAIGHSALTKVGETNPDNSIVSVGPDPGGPWIFNPFKFKNGTNNWKNYVNSGDKVMKVSIKGINFNRLRKYGAYLDKGMNYNLYCSSCVSHAARALTISGVPTLGIHPFILHSQMVLRSVGFRPMLYSNYFYQF